MKLELRTPSLVLAVLVLASMLPMGATADQPLPATDGELLTVLKASSGKFDVYVSNRGGVIKSVILHEEQFRQKADEPPKGSVQPPAARLAEGPLDLVTTWDGVLLPLGIAFEDPSPLNMGRIVRVETPVTAVAPPADASAAQGPSMSAEPSGPAAVTANADQAAEKAGQGSMQPAGDSAVAQPVAEPVITWTTEPVDFWSAYVENPEYKVVDSTAVSVLMVWPDPAVYSSPLYIERSYRIVDDYRVESTIRLVSFSQDEVSGLIRLSIPAWESASTSGGYCGGMFGAPPDLLEAVCGTAKDIDRKKRKDILDDKNLEIAESATFAGVSSRYFLNAVLPAPGNVAQCVAGASEVGVVETTIRWGNESGGKQLIKGVRGLSCIPAWLAGTYGMEGRLTCAQAAAILGVSADIGVVELSAMKDLPPEKESARQALMARRDRLIGFTFFSGPKDLSLLKSMSAGLENSIDFGWFGVLAKPMLWLMRMAHGIIPSWGLAIIFLTIIVKLITLPFTHTSMKQMRRMSELKPRIDELQKKYKDDKVKLNEATMELYKREKINPLGGCLPMLIQMPIWIALYRTIYSAVDLYQAPLGLWISDLSARDPYFVLPVLLGVIMWINQKITPVTGDPSQAKIMLWMMPIMFSAMMLFLPSGLVFYILTNTVLSIFHTMWNNRGLKKKVVTR